MNLKNISTVLCLLLETNKNHLAGLLGVTEKSLLSWKNGDIDLSTKKHERMIRLYEICKFIYKKYPQINNFYYRRILENSTIIFDEKDNEGFTSVMNSVIHNSFLDRNTLENAINDYLNETNFEILQKTTLLDIIYNSRIIFDDQDEEDGSVSLIGYILSNIENNPWEESVIMALEEYNAFLNTRLINKGRF